LAEGREKENKSFQSCWASSKPAGEKSYGEKTFVAS